MIARRMAATAFCVALFAAALPHARAQGVPAAKTPEETGMSAERLKRLSAAMKNAVDKGEIPGAVVLVGRNGRIAYLESFGFRDREAKAPMKPWCAQG